MRDIILDVLAEVLKGKLKKDKISELLEMPPQQEMGDYAFPCFLLAKIEKKSPLLISQELTEKIRKKLPKEISGVEVKSAYVNFFINKKLLVKKVLEESLKKDYGCIKKKKPLRVGLEFPSPNTNKPLHVGHLRNITLGESISNIIYFCGDKTFHLNLYNDRGILISKSMMGYEKYGKNKTPKKEKMQGDAFVGKYYVLFSKDSKENPELDKMAQEKLKKWENKDPETLKLWKKMNSWAYQGMKKTYKKFGLSKIDKTYYESEIYLQGKEIIEEGLNKKIFEKRKDGAVIINLEKENLGEKVLLRPDETAVYMTTDLYLAKQKIQDFKLDSSYYVVGNDQKYHFDVLFTILDKLGMKKNWKHLAYGMVVLPEGKMKSREGNAVSAEELIEETKTIAKKGLIERKITLNEKELEKRSMQIALAAIKYWLLKIDSSKDLVFNPKEAIEFEGNTGPYLLYSYARASSILRKIKNKNKNLKVLDLSPSEISLIKKIQDFPEIVKKSYRELAPNLMANYCYELAKIFNEFYHSHQVIGSAEEGLRLKIIYSFKNVLKKSLNILGIQELEEM
jgi:arginyl-tRNA synthetase